MVERLQARPSKISFSSYKGYKTEESGGLRGLSTAVVPGIHPRSVVLPGLPRLPALVFAFHAGRDTKGTKGGDPQDDDAGRGGQRDTAHEPAPQGCVGSEEHRHDRERDRACDSSRDPAHRLKTFPIGDKRIAARISVVSILGHPSGYVPNRRELVCLG